MALITCPVCGKQISDRAVSCPHCGEPIQGQEPMMEYQQQQEPVQQYNESGTNNNRKYVVPLAIVAGVLLAVLVGIIAYNSGAKNMDETATESASESHTAVDTSNTSSPAVSFGNNMQQQSQDANDAAKDAVEDALKSSAEETSEDVPSIPRSSRHHHRSSRPHNPSIDEMINNAPPAAWR